MQRLLVVELMTRQLQRVWEDRHSENSWLVVAGKGLRAESIQQNLKTNQPVARRLFYKHFSTIMSGSFRHQPFLELSGKLGGKVPVVDDVLSPHVQAIYHATSLEEDCIEFEFQTDRNYYVNLRQTNLALKLKIVRDRGYEAYNSKEVKKKHEEGTNKSG